MSPFFLVYFVFVCVGCVARAMVSVWQSEVSFGSRFSASTTGGQRIRLHLPGLGAVAFPNSHPITV